MGIQQFSQQPRELELDCHVVPIPPSTWVQLTLMVLVEEQLGDVVEPLVIDTHAH
jgi:hypothetical protein